MSVIFNIVTLLDDHPISHHLSCAPSHPPWWLQLPTPLLGSLAVEPPQLRTVGIFAPKLPWKSWGKMSFYRVFYHVLHHQNWINLDLWFSRCSDNPIWCSQFLIPFLTIRLSFVTISAASPESCSTWEESDGSCFCTLKLGGFYLRLIKLISFHIYQTYFSDLCNLMWSISSLYLCISISSRLSRKDRGIPLFFGLPGRAESRLPHDWAKQRCCFGGSPPRRPKLIHDLLHWLWQQWLKYFHGNIWNTTNHLIPFCNVKQADKNDMFGVNMLDKKKDMNMTSSNLSRKVPRYSHGYSHSCHGPSILVFTYVIPQKISDIGRNHIIQYSVVRIIWSWLSSISGTSLDLPYILCILYYIYRYIDI